MHSLPQMQMIFFADKGLPAGLLQGIKAGTKQMQQPFLPWKHGLSMGYQCEANKSLMTRQVMAEPSCVYDEEHILFSALNKI